VRLARCSVMVDRCHTLRSVSACEAQHLVAVSYCPSIVASGCVLPMNDVILLTEDVRTCNHLNNAMKLVEFQFCLVMYLYFWKRILSLALSYNGFALDAGRGFKGIQIG
jgi:hypothetical protein